MRVTVLWKTQHVFTNARGRGIVPAYSKKEELLDEIVATGLVPPAIKQAKRKLRMPVVLALHALACGDGAVGGEDAARLITQANKLKQVEKALEDIARG